MNGTERVRRGLAHLLLMLGVWLSTAPAAAAQGAGSAGLPEASDVDPQAGVVTLQELYELAAQRNPRLAAARAMTDAAEAMEASAGLPPDPMLEIGAMNFSVPGFSSDMPTSMAPSLRAMQMLPFPGKLGLSRRIAEQSTQVRDTQARESWWEVRTAVAKAFYLLYAVDHELEVMGETLTLLEDFERIARAMYSAGEGRQADILRAGVEIARMEAEIERMDATRRVARARLNALLDRPGDTPMGSPSLPRLPATTPPVEILREWAGQSRPFLEGGRLEVERAGARQELARREIWPDFTVGVEYGRRSTADMGVERMGSVMVGFSVPVFARSRQYGVRDEAAAIERMARADLAEREAEVDGSIAGLTAELERSRTLIRLFRTDVLPQARANVESSLASYRVGSVDFMTLVDAQMSVNRYEAELYGLLADYGAGIAELEMTLGRELPLGTDWIVEEDR